MKKLNKTGPSTDPWGAPVVTLVTYPSRSHSIGGRDRSLTSLSNLAIGVQA